MMKHTALRFTIAALLLLLVACHKEGSGRVELVLEPLNNANVKLAVVNDVDAVWCDGDEINFNGSVVAITREDETHAYISDVYSQSVNSACFPANLATTDLGGNTVGVLLPSAYHYRRDGSGRQLVELPMMARAADGEPMQFRHLTAALCITLSNDRTDSKTLVIDSLTVSSNNYLLCGPRSADMTSAEPLGAQALGEGTSTVTLFFDRERLELAPGDSRKVMVPVAPVGDGNRFTISVATRCQGTRYNYSRTQTTGGALPRNMLAYASMTLNDSPTRVTDLFTGVGSDGSPFLIKNHTDFLMMIEACNERWTLNSSTYLYRDQSFKIDKVIDMAGYVVQSISRFKGKINAQSGNGIISNLIVTSSDDCCGVFDTLENCEINNLTIQNLVLQSSSVANPLSVGGFCGVLLGGALSNCNITGSFIVNIGNPSGSIYVGGIAGNVYENNVITNCSVSHNQSFLFNATEVIYGGLLGYCHKKESAPTAPTIGLNGCDVSHSMLSIENSGKVIVGGLIGSTQNVKSTIKGCNWTGNMEMESTNNNVVVGGLLGNYSKGNEGSISITGDSTFVIGTIAATSFGAASYVGAYIGMSSAVLYLAASPINHTTLPTMSLNGVPVSKEIGNR